METRSIGSLTVSVVGLGCNNFGARMDDADVDKVVGAALDAGVTLFDTADVYGGTRSEELLGQALRGRRDEAVVATKFGAPVGEGKAGAAPDYVRSACEDSLRRLGMDHIDLYQLHMPDASTPIEDTLGALDELVQAGKVCEIGCSNFSPDLLDAATAAAGERGLSRFVSVQNELSLLRRKGDADLLDACDRHDMVLLPYFPLASGLLTGKYKRGEEAPAGTRLANAPAERRERAFTDKNFDKVEALEAFASSRGHTLLELAMSWLAGLPRLASVIAGATSVEQVRSNAAGAGWALTADDRAELDSITAP